MFEPRFASEVNFDQNFRAIGHEDSLKVMLVNKLKEL